MPESQKASQIERALGGDTAAKEALLADHLPSLLAYVRLQAGPLVRAKESLSDVVQSVCADVLSDLDGFEYRGPAQFRHWLFVRALHKIQDKNRFYRAARRDAGREVVEGADERTLALCYASVCSPSRVAMGHEKVAAFEAAFGRLAPDYRQAVALHRIVGLDYAQVAEQMGRSVRAVRNLVYRGIAKLAAELSANGESP